MIEIIGSNYNPVDMVVDTVEPCYGFIIVKDGNETLIYEGDYYKDGLIVDCFMHYESDCVFFVVKCQDVYFCVYPEYDSYKMVDENKYTFR